MRGTLKASSIPKEIIDKIQDSADLVHLISGYVNLRKSGKEYFGLCPFHAETTPSFHVNPVKQLFHCFGCNTGGNIFKFLMLQERMSFPEAVREAGRMSGIAVPENDGRDFSDDAELMEINEAAGRFYRRTLLENPDSQVARSYLANREIKAESIEKFGIGYAPAGRGDSCFRFLKGSGYDPVKIERAGLVVGREPGKNGYDRFRGRLMFPVLDSQGRCVAFGGRVLDNSHPKYLNSPESPVYQKGRLLFALDKVREQPEKPDSLVIVEGYFDALRPYQEGIRNVVATCGTALTPQHLQSIRRICRKVILVFDPDKAGIRAALRSVELFLGSGLKATVAVLPDGLDPDQFVSRKGADAFRAATEKGVPLFDFALGEIIRKNAPLDIDGKMNVVNEFLPLILKMSNPVEKTYYLTRVANELCISQEDLLESYRRIRNEARTQVREEAGGRARSAQPDPPLPQEEEFIVRFLLAEKIAPDQIFRYLDPADFSDRRAFRFATAVREKGFGSEILSTRSLMALFEEEENLQDWLTGLAVKDPGYDFPLQALEESIEKLRQRKKRRLQVEIEKRIPLAEQQKDHKQVSEFLKEIVAIQSHFNERVKL
jgi:DNA primase